jgi:hypothetical protein
MLGPKEFWIYHSRAAPADRQGPLFYIFYIKSYCRP